MITLEVNGVDLTGFTEIDVSRRLDTVSGDFSFRAVSTSNRRFPVRVNDPIRVMVDNTPVITGYAEYINVTYSSGTHEVLIRGRDITADFIDSTLGEKITFTGGVTLEQVARATLDSLNLNSVGVISNVALEPFAATVEIASEIGQTGFAFLEGYARQKNVLLTTDGLGNLVITRSSTTPIATYLLNQVRTGNVSNNSNNILEGGVTNDMTARYNTYVVRSGDSLTTLAEFDGFENIEQYTESLTDSAIQNIGTTQDVAIRPSRTFELQAEHPSTSSQCSERAIWEANYRRAKSFDYYCTVQGHTATQDRIPWAPNLLVKVIDDFCDVDANLLIEQVRFTYSVNSGSKTQLTLVTADAYQLETNRTANDAAANNQSNEFNSLAGKTAKEIVDFFEEQRRANTQ